MRKYFLIIFLCMATSAFSQMPANKSRFILTDKDKKNYILTIGQKKITKARDTVFWNKKHYRCVTVSVKLSNLSNTTLEYINMDCSSSTVFKTSDKEVFIGQWPCQENNPVISEIEAHKSYLYKFDLFFPNKPFKKFKINLGMYLCKYSNTADKDTFVYDLIHNKWQQSCLIWSNEVTIPKS